ncbi:MAG: hypothetical protein ABFD77_09900 [Thermotogota bacterium]
MTDEGIVTVDLGGRLKIKTGCGNIELAGRKLKVTWIDPSQMAACLDLVLEKEQFEFPVSVLGNDLVIKNRGARFDLLGYNARTRGGMLALRLSS